MRQVRPTISPLAVADRRDAVQRALDAGAVVVAEMTDAPFNIGEVVTGDVITGNGKLVLMEAGFRHTTKIHDDLDQRAVGRILLEEFDSGADLGRQHCQEIVDVIRKFGFVILAAIRPAGRG